MSSNTVESCRSLLKYNLINSLDIAIHIVPYTVCMHLALDQQQPVTITTTTTKWKTQNIMHNLWCHWINKWFFVRKYKNSYNKVVACDM